MINLEKTFRKNIFPITLILVLAFSRLIPHPPNFTPIIAMAVMSGFFFRNIYLSLTTLFISMLLADIFIGFYNNMLFVYLSLLLISIIFFKINYKINYKNLLIFAFTGTLIFYLISNFGVWAMGSLYEKNMNGLINCYFLAIPFFKNSIISTIIFSYATFFAKNYMEKKIYS